MKRAKVRRLKSCRCHGCDEFFDCAEAVVVKAPCCNQPVLVCAKCAWFAIRHFDSAASAAALGEAL
jgi:hypothetical protein